MDLYSVIGFCNKDGDNSLKQNDVESNNLDNIFKSYKLSEEESSKIQDSIHIGFTIDYIPYWKYFNIQDDVCLNYW
jgi:hypothetical protein